MSVDTVEQAGTSPDVEQPWAELGLKQDEYERIREILGRRPTSSELAMYWPTTLMPGCDLSNWVSR